MTAKPLNQALVSAAARRPVLALALLLPIAALAAAANSDVTWKNAGVDEGLQRAFERATQHPLAAGPAWMQQQEIIATDGGAYDGFGSSVSVSGNTAVIGAPGKNARGAAYVFVQSGGVWSLQQELTASDGASDDQFGLCVSVSGDTAVIGASQKPVGSNTAQGAAYVFVRSDGVWTEQQELTALFGAAGDQFGWSVSVSGNTAVIGAPGAGSFQGAAHVFVLNGGGWAEQQELAASDGAAGDSFGWSVSVSGDAAVIGAPGPREGAAYVFVQNAGSWSQQQELAASDAAKSSGFGGSVSVSGDTAVIGAQGGDGGLGAAYVFVQNAGTWSQQQELTADNGAADDYLGSAVSVSGDTVAVKAYGDAEAGIPGAACLFERSGGVWGLQQDLLASPGWFGGPVSLSGTTLVVGAALTAINQRVNQGAAYVFTVTQPTITGVGVSGGGASAAQNAWVEIYGSILAPATASWSAADFVFGQMPTELGGVSVTVNGAPAYVSFVSTSQVNVLTPLDSTTGPVAVVVNNGATASAAFTANLQPVSPGFLRFGDGIHIAAEHADYSLLGPPSLSVPGYTFTPAAPGETITLYGDGFGLPVTTLTPGSDVQVGVLPTPWPQVTIGGTPATVTWAGLNGDAGLYQINVTVPTTATAGDNQVIATYGGFSSSEGALIPVSR